MVEPWPSEGPRFFSNLHPLQRYWRQLRANGADFTITPAMVVQAGQVLEQYQRPGNPELQGVIAREIEALDLDSFAELTLVLLAVLILSTLLAVVEIGREQMVLAKEPIANRLSSPLGEDVEHNGQDQDNTLDNLLPK